MPAGDRNAGENASYTEKFCAQNASGGSPVDFAWLLFVGTKMLGFTEREVGHFTLKKWSLLYKHFRVYHNFCIGQQLFKEEKTSESTSDEWLPG